MFFIILAIIFIVGFCIEIWKKYSDNNYSYDNISVEASAPAPAPKEPMNYEPLPDSFPIDINNFVKTQSDEVYLIPDNYTYLAYNSVETINLMLRQASDLVRAFPRTTLHSSELSFNGNPDVREYTTLSYHPYTPTGRIAKYPYSINFHNSQPLSIYTRDANGDVIIKSGDSLFGTVYHLADGRIGKMRIIKWYNDTGYFVNCGIKKAALQVIKIEKSDNGEQKTLYNFNAK